MIAMTSTADCPQARLAASLYTASGETGLVPSFWNAQATTQVRRTS